MFIFGAIFSFIGRQAGRIANVIFGWATVMLFGKVPKEKQTWLSVVALGSIVWLVVTLGIIFPSVGLLLLSFVPAPRWVPKWVLRAAMIAAFFILPLLIGAVSSIILVAERKHGWDLVKSVFRGYPYTVALAVTMIMMAIFVPVLKIPAILKRWEDQHIAVMIEPKGYNHVVSDLRKALEKGGTQMERRSASVLLRIPPQILGLAAGGGIASLVAKDLATLRSPKGDLEVIVYPSDLMVRGEPKVAEAAMATVTREMVFTDAHLTWTKEANHLEDRLRAMWQALEGKKREEIIRENQEELQGLRGVEEALRKAQVPYDEWRILYREKLQVEERLLTTLAGVSGRATAPTESSEAAKGLAPLARPARQAPPLAAAAVVALGTLLIGGVLVDGARRARR